jgi:hypothetical protein
LKAGFVYWGAKNRMKFTSSLLVLCLALSVGLAVAQNNIDENHDNTDKTANAIDDMVGNVTCFVNGTSTIVPRMMDNITDMDNTTGAETHYINATIECTAMNNMTEGAQAGNVTSDQTRDMTNGQEISNMADTDNTTKTKMCNITGTMTLIPMDTIGSQAGNMTGTQAEGMTGNQTNGNMTDMENITEARAYSINATVVCMPESTNNMTGEAQAGSMAEDMTGTRTYYITGIVILTPTDMTGSQTGGNMTEDMAGAHTYTITATVACMPEAMNNIDENMTGETQTENVAGQTGLNTTGGQEGSNMADTGNITRAKMCDITGIMTLAPIDMTGSQAGNMTGTQTEGTGSQTDGNMSMENMTGARTYSLTATVACMPKTTNNISGGAQAENMIQSNVEYNSQTEVNTSGI